MDRTTIISIITPVYNSSKYLKECIDSIINQTYTNFELLLIDDGSTDDSLEIIKTFEKEDNRIRVFTKLHSGVSDTRNLGLENAKGEIITCIDSDDTVDKQYLEFIIKMMSDDNTDMTIMTCLKQNYIIPEQIETYNNENLHTLFINRDLYSIGGKAFRTSIIRNNHLFFPSNIGYGEDRLFVLNYISCLDKNLKILKENKQFYYYRDNCNSVSNTQYITAEVYDLTEKVLINILDKSTIKYKQYNEAMEKLSWEEVLAYTTDAFVHMSGIHRYRRLKEIANNDLLIAMAKRYQPICGMINKMVAKKHVLLAMITYDVCSLKNKFLKI